MPSRRVSPGTTARRPRVLRAVPLSLMALLFCVPQAAFAATSPKNVGDTGPIVSGYRITKCIDDSGDGTANDTPVVISDCNGTPEQSWTIEADGTIQLNGKCMDVYRDGKVNKTKVELWQCHGGTNQQWKMLGGALVNPVSGKCLDIPRFDVADGTQLEIYTCNGGRNQSWSLP
jgi:hypothetical protein